MTKSMQIHLDGAFIGQTSSSKAQRFMYPWTGTQGPIIRGKLIVHHREDLTLKALTLTFKAKICCDWSERQGKSTAFFSAKKGLLEKTWVFLEKSDTKLHLLRANQAYSYSFELALPVNLPNSLAMGTGRIEYMFSANGKRSAFQLDLDADCLIEIYQSLPPAHPYCIQPLQVNADFEKALNYLVQIPRKAFYHGSAIPITVRMSPIAGVGARWHVKEMHISLKEYFWFISPGKGTRHEKRTLVETVQARGSWPVQAGLVERIISITVPSINIMTTVDTEIIKCTHKLKLQFTIEVNGSSKKLAAEFDVYIPGPFPPGQGPMGASSQLQSPPPPLPQRQQQQLQLQLQQEQQLPAYQQYPSMPQITQQQQYQTLSHSTQQQYTTMSHLTQQQQQQQQQQYPPVPQASPFSPPLTPQHAQQPMYPTPPANPTSTPGSTPGIGSAVAAPHPYSQGYPTPTTSNSYPMPTSSQGYPTPAMPLTPTMPAYPMPPSPSLAHTSNQVAPAPSPGLAHMAMPVPSPQPPAAQPSPAIVEATFATSYIDPPPLSHQNQQQRITTPPKVDSSKAATGSQGLQVDDSIKVFVNVDDAIKVNVDDIVRIVPNDAIKVNLDDIKVPSAPPTPAMPVLSTSGTAPGTPSTGPHSKNPQVRNSYSGSSSNEVKTPQHQAFDAFISAPMQPQAPHTTSDVEEENKFSYQPPPPSSVPTPPSSSTSVSPPALPTHTNNVNPYAAAAAAAAAASATVAVSSQQQQHELSQQFSQMGLGVVVPPPPPSPSGSFSSQVPAVAIPSPSFAQPPSPLNRPGASTSVSYSSAMSPVSAAATGAVTASHQHQQHQQQQQQYQLQQQQQQQGYQPPPFSAAPTIMSQPQRQQSYQLQHRMTLPPQPQKQQVWIPMYQTLGNKTYVQYKPAA